MGRFDSQEDFFLAGERTVDGQLHDGWASVPVIGREIEGAVLVARMEGFLTRSAELDPAETLALVNKFFAWVATSALRGRCGIVERCVGGELTMLFMSELGSEDPFGEALATARVMCEDDAAGFAPRIGVAAGALIVGYVGPPLRYSCSVVGRTVAEAEHCAALEPQLRRPHTYATAVTFPEADWRGRRFDQAFGPHRWRAADGRIEEWPYPWEQTAPREVEMARSAPLVVRQAVAQIPELGGDHPEDEVRPVVQRLRGADR